MQSINHTEEGITMQATSDKTYNGWTNYATWGVALVLDNDEGTYNEVNEHVEAIRLHISVDTNVKESIWTEESAIRFRLADWLKDYTETLCGLGTASLSPSLMAQQLLGAALSDVNWEEIADHYTEES